MEVFFNKRTHHRPGAIFVSLAIAILLLNPGGNRCYALNSHNIRGVILDAESGLPVVGAQADLIEYEGISITDKNGGFIIRGIPSGVYTLIVEAEGYYEYSHSIIIGDGPDKEITVRIKPRVYLFPDVVVLSAKYPRRNLRGTLIGEIALSDEESTTADGLGDIVRKLPGAYIRKGGQSNAETVSINGCDPSRVMVVFDGMVLNGGSGTAVDLSEIPVGAISKVELYSGTGAIGGTLVITSRLPKGDDGDGNISIDGSYGSFGAKKLKSKIGVGGKRVRLNFYSESFRTNGDFGYTDKFGNSQRRINNYVKSQNLFGRIVFPSISSPTFSFQYYHSKKGSPGPLLQIDSTAQIKTRKLSANLKYGIVHSNNNSLKLGVNGLLQRDNYKSIGGFYKYDLETAQTRCSSWLNLDSKLNKLMVKFDLDYIYEDFRTEDYMGGYNAIPLKSRRHLKVNSSSQYKIPFKNSLIPLSLEINLGGGADLISGYKSFWTYDWSVDMTARKAITLSSGVFGGTSFRLPDYYSLFFKENIFALGNPDLRPERGKVFGFRVNLVFPVKLPSSIGYNYTINEIRDIIVWNQRFDGKYRPVNLRSSLLKTNSLSLDVGSSDSPLSFKFLANRYRPLNKSDFRLYKDKYLLFRPLHSASLDIEFGNKIVRAEISHQWVGKRFIRMENTLWLDPYQTTDAGVKFKFKIKHIKTALHIRINNLGDERYEIIERYPSPGRNYRCGVSISF